MTTKPQYLEVGGQQLVVMTAAEYKILLRKAEYDAPPLPEPDEDGNYPLEALAILIAQDIVKARRDLGLTQVELAKLAGIRPETLHRIEQGKNSPNVRTMEKLDAAIKRAERKQKKKHG